MAWWHRQHVFSPDTSVEVSEPIQTTNITIKGDEPFLTFGNARVIVNLTDYSRRSHNFEWPATDFEQPWSIFKRGDVLRIEFSKVTQVQIPWYKRLLLKLVEKVL